MRILIIDDHQLLIDALARHLTDVHGFAVEFALDVSAGVALLQSASAPFDVVLLDFRLPGLSGPLAAEQVKAAAGLTPVILFSGTVDGAAVRAMLACGINGFVPKSTKLSHMAATLRAAADGVEVFPAGLLVDLARCPAPELSSANHRILTLIAEGKTNREIGQTIDMAEHNVKAHVRTIFKTLKVSSRTAAVMKARECGVLG